jgi:hypothetical protein
MHYKDSVYTTGRKQIAFIVQINQLILWKVKVKSTLDQATKEQRESRGIDLLFL